MTATRTVHRAGIDLAVREVGDPSHEPLVVAHGVGSSARFIVEAFGRPVTRAGLRLVAYDLRGHGASTPVRSPADHTLAVHAADLAAVAAAVGARIVAGVSLGGHAAVAAASEGAFDAVCACLPAWTGRAIPGVGPHAAVAAAAAADGVAVMRARFRHDPGLPPWLAALLERDWASHDADSLAAALVALDGGLAPTEADIRGLSTPLAVVGWPDDAAHPLEVASAWASWAPTGALARTTMAAVGRDRSALGAAAVEALAAVAAPLGQHRLRRP